MLKLSYIPQQLSDAVFKTLKCSFYSPDCAKAWVVSSLSGGMNENDPLRIIGSGTIRMCDPAGVFVCSCFVSVVVVYSLGECHPASK